MGLAEDVRSVFGDKDLYSVLDIKKDATAAEIKRAYYKHALKYHPDKCPGDEAAHSRFQALSMVHQVLSNEESRSLYDETGELQGEDSELNEESVDTWYEYWRELFPKVTVARIDAFEAEYKNSEEERRDVLAAYEEQKGDMRKVIDEVILASEADEERFRAIVEGAISAGDAERYAAFQPRKKRAKSDSKKRAKADKEAAEAEELMAAIKAKQQQRSDASLGKELAAKHRGRFDSMISSLESKYAAMEEDGGGGKAKNKKKRAAAAAVEPPDIDDAEFERIRASLGSGGGGGGGGGRKRSGRKAAGR